MTLRELIDNFDAPVATGDLDAEITGLAYDSRKVGPGMVFFALRGSAIDGHDFIDRAVAAGCAAVVAEQAPPDNPDTPWIHVRQSRIAMAQAAATFHGHPGKQLRLSAVTGTNGKTTIAFLVHHLLNEGQIRAGLIGTLFYDLGGDHEPATHTTPESLELQGLLAEMRDHGCGACALEVSSHALDQYRAHELTFETAIFSNLTQDHLDYHGSLPKYFAAKTRLFETVADQRAGQMILNLDDPYGRKLITRYEDTRRITTYGYGVQADYRATNVRYDMTGTSFELTVKGRSYLVRSPLIGDFNVYNALAAIAAAHTMKLNLRETLRHLQHAPQVPGRLERITDQGRFQVYVDYAHTPDALTNVLKTVRGLRPSRIITVFGCGGDRDRTKRPKMAAAAAAGSDICILTSDNPRGEAPTQIIADAAKGFPRGTRSLEIVDRREAIETALRNAGAGDLVLIAGKGHEDYQEIEGERHPFDDRKAARKVLEILKHELPQ